MVARVQRNTITISFRTLRVCATSIKPRRIPSFTPRWPSGRCRRRFRPVSTRSCSEGLPMSSAFRFRQPRLSSSPRSWASASPPTPAAFEVAYLAACDALRHASDGLRGCMHVPQRLHLPVLGRAFRFTGGMAWSSFRRLYCVTSIDSRVARSKPVDTSEVARAAL
jgi:hypothetical protein